MHLTGMVHKAHFQTTDYKISKCQCFQNKMIIAQIVEYQIVLVMP